MSKKSQSSMGYIRKKHKENEKRSKYREKENNKKRRAGTAIIDKEQIIKNKDDDEMDMMCKYAKENAERISANKTKKRRNHE